VVARGMAKEPAERFATATELARACAAALGRPAAQAAPLPARAAVSGPPVGPTVVSD